MCLQSPRDINEAVDRFHEFLVRFLYCLTGDEHTAENLAQDVWLRIWKGLHTYDPARGPYRTWLCWLARQRAYVANRARRNHPLSALDEEAAGAVAPSTSDPFKEAVRQETEERV